MMWKTISPMISPYSAYSSEPPELRKLKFQLAHVSCKCNVCLRNTHQLHEKISQLKKWKDVNVQTAAYIQEPKLNPNYGLCPKCCLTLSILKDGVVRVLKDEGSETQPLITYDKATERDIERFEKACSVNSRPIQCYSNLTLDDFSSGCDLSKNGSIERKRSRNERVKFIDLPETKSEEVSTTYPYNGNFTCLDAFIDSIRPPSGDVNGDVYKLNNTITGLPLEV